MQTALEKRTDQLRRLIQGEGLAFAMEAHSALSAKIAEGQGFEAVWASGFSIAASMGLADRNEASWSQVCDVVEFMADHVNVPILMDGDTGFGNFNNVSRLVKRVSQRNVAGICIEDKLFPKVNSFVETRQQLADVADFVAKLRAARDSRTDPSFCIVARTEALIAGCAMEEALRRAESYADAGADAILVHSKEHSGDEVIEFTSRWGNRCPLVIVPTAYYKRPTEDFKKAGVAMIIWANHSLRAAVKAMKEVTRQIYRDQSVAAVEEGIASMADIFGLTTEMAAREAEIRYAPPSLTESASLARTSMAVDCLAGGYADS